MKRFFARVHMDANRVQSLKALERTMQFRFKDLSLLHRSLVHSSYLQTEQGDAEADNETLEFLGDSVFGLVIAAELFKLYPDAQVGELAKVKAQVVSRATLGEIALTCGLDQWILMGPGETSRGESRRISVVGSALEAVVGALYLDSGLRPAEKLIKQLCSEYIHAIQMGEAAIDHKSLLQEYVLRYFKATPGYRVSDETGPSHAKSFVVEVHWQGKSYGTGRGSSKKLASQDAAKQALEHLLGPAPLSTDEETVS